MKLTDNKAIKYVKESKTELKKVVWPSKKDTTLYTILVIAISISIAAFMGIIDFGLTKGFESFVGESTAPSTLPTHGGLTGQPVQVQPNLNPTVETEAVNEDGSPVDVQITPVTE